MVAGAKRYGELVARSETQASVIRNLGADRPHNEAAPAASWLFDPPFGDDMQ